MDIELIREFITLSGKLNFSETAKMHYITQPVLSKHIRSLEKELGVDLFYRSRQNVDLTPMGKVFLEEALKVVETWDGAVEKVQEATKQYRSSLSIAFLDAASRDWLPDWLSAFMSENINVSLQVKSADIPEIYQYLENREVDLALTMEPPLDNDPSYDFIHIYKDPLCVALRKDHSLAGNDYLTFDQIKNEKLICASPNLVSDYQRFLDILLKEHHVEFSVKKTVESVEQGFMFIEAGLGITIVPMHQRYLTSSRVKLIPLAANNCYVNVVLTWKRDNNNPCIAKFLEIVKRQM